LVIQLIADGFGLGLMVPVMTSVLLGAVDRPRSGLASGTLNAACQAGSVLGVALFGPLAAGTSAVSGLHIALLIGTGLIMAVAALGTWL
jgi:DHA2 family methylenomycin A resistance protein-like MFS transporter